MSMTEEHSNRILTINSGSSSVKLALYHVGISERLVLSGKIDRIGLTGSHFEIKDAGGVVLTRRELDLRDHKDALKVLLDWLHDHMRLKGLDAVGHRLVHGGLKYVYPHVITPELLSSLQKLIPLAPGHLPQALGTIDTVRQWYPDLMQVACFDTAFHRQMPDVAQMYALPADLVDKGVIRYGFHGLSCEYVVQELRRQAGSEADGRIIIAHLGNGASLTAVQHGKSVDTTMGFTPAGGLVMSTRSGDLDPGVLVYLLEEQGVKATELNDMVNRKSGLLGVSGISSDMKDILDREKEDPRAASAVNLFCYQAKKFLSALAGVLGGLDTLIFTAGVGENAPPVRRRICEGLEFLGIRLNPGRNAANAPIISGEASQCKVRVMHTDEDLMIARQTNGLILNNAREQKTRGDYHG
jgi:acetate kinase